MPRERMTADVKNRLAADLGEAATETTGRKGGDRVAEQVRTWIFNGALRDGDVISQEDLAELLGVSRIPVRDALITLAAAGWVLLEPGIGARAIGLDAAAVRDSFHLMGTIWALLARRAVERHALTDRLLAAGARVSTARTAPAMTTANVQFRGELCTAAAAPRLSAAFRSSARIVPGDFFTVVPRAIQVQRRLVPKIATAIDTGNIDHATQLAIALHHHHANSITNLLTTHGIFDAASVRPTTPSHTQQTAEQSA